MTSNEILERKAQIAVEMDAEGANLDALLEETRSLNAQLEEMRSVEAKKEELRNLAAVAATEKTFEKEDAKMENRTFGIETVEYRDAYMKQLQGKPMAVEERDALTSAANVIPTQTVNKIYGKLEENGLIKEINALHIPGYVAIPKATTVNDANWVAMATAATDSADVVGTVALSAYKLIKTIEITADIQAMSIAAFESWLVEKLAKKMERAICKAILVGAGSTEPTGLIPGMTAKVSSMNTLAKFSSLMGKLGGAYHPNAVWVMSAETFYGTVMGLATDKNGILVQNGIEKMLLGHKVVLDDNCDVTVENTTTKNVLFGDLNEGYAFNFGEGISIDRDGSVAFRSGSTVYRAMALCDGKPVDPDAVVLGTI